MDASSPTFPVPELCTHLQQLVNDRGYRFDQTVGHWLVKTCLHPTNKVLRDTCSKLVPVDSLECFSCRGTSFGPVTDHFIELTSCHYRCQRCKMVTPGCGVTKCADCGAKNVTLLPVAINVDVYGWRLARSRE